MIQAIGFSVLCGVGAHLVYSAWLEWMGALVIGGSKAADCQALAKVAGGVGLVVFAIGWV